MNTCLAEIQTTVVATVTLLADYAREIALAIVVIGITSASIVPRELVPKRIAMQHPEAVATMVTEEEIVREFRLKPPAPARAATKIG